MERMQLKSLKKKARQVSQTFPQDGSKRSLGAKSMERHTFPLLIQDWLKLPRSDSVRTRLTQTTSFLAPEAGNRNWRSMISPMVGASKKYIYLSIYLCL